MVVYHWGKARDVLSRRVRSTTHYAWRWVQDAVGILIVVKENFLYLLNNGFNLFYKSGVLVVVKGHPLHIAKTVSGLLQS